MALIYSTDPTGEVRHATSDDVALLARHGRALLSLARASIAWRLRAGSSLALDPAHYADEIQVNRAAFATLKKNGELRGCVGTMNAWRPLVTDVAENAAAAALEDRRFPPVVVAELPALEIAISILTAPSPIQAGTEAELIAQLRPGIDGLILRDSKHHALFLPQVWTQLDDPQAFLAHLKAKAGLAEEYWSPALTFERFTSHSIAESQFAPD
ncbi:MAG TPA: AmmeMemoRadiSam system protein A [Alphaproteobacteria bacterium]|nr:AmmeMemoRadiSam system protein A [Alphaproteobacteria bacterium]